jgi:hypothetical protein
MMYLPDSDSLWRIPGASYWNTVAASGQDVQGLTHCRFENTSAFLVAQASGKLWTANAESDGSAFASATINTTGLSNLSTGLWSVPFDNRCYIFNGVDDNRVMLQDGTSRVHGLYSVQQKPSLSNMFTSAFSASATGYYEYWCTEVVKFSDGQELESAFAGTPLTVRVTSLTSAPEIEMTGTPVNVLAVANVSSHQLQRLS